MDRSSRYLIGIDLGTTNTVVAYVDTAESAEGVTPHIRVFDVPQVVAPGEVRALAGLASFLYFPTEAEIESGAFDLPWLAKPQFVVGAAAREHGSLVPGRQVSSAKSWLCQDAVDRTADILPREAEPPEPKISPVEASTRYLLHLRSAWNHAMAAAGSATDLLFEHQDIVLTVPASFDEEARELTVEVARRAGLQHLTLLEEPLAAFYAWVAKHRGSLAEQVNDRELVLICDIGGGTSDFTLVRAHIEGADVQFERTAIGEHLLLGGENLDLALARRVEQKLNASLSLRQRHSLEVTCSQAKERLLNDETLERVPISVLGSGRAVVGQMLTSELTRVEVVSLLTNGFLPLTSPEDMPTHAGHAGLREVGLPYASDPAITKHLAAFMRNAATSMSATSQPSGPRPELAKPDAVLFNGGFCIPGIARERIVAAIAKWFDREAKGWRPRILPSAGLESAVAVGAAYYGQVRRGAGLRVKAGSARSYYIGTREENTAICVLPAGTDEGSTLPLARDFSVLANRPVSFNLFSSTVRHDHHGALAEFDPSQMHRHAPLVTLLRYGKKLQQMDLAVRLSVSFTEVGTLELWCEAVNSAHRWRLQFELRGSGATTDGQGTVATSHHSATAEVPEENVTAASQLLRTAFSSGAQLEAIDPASLTSVLESTIGLKKESWGMPVVRAFADALLEVASGRSVSARHEVRWLNLFGYCMRPGFGDAQDSTRLSQARKIYQAGLAFPDNLQSQVDWLVAWRRVAGGLSAAHQHELRNYLGNLGIGKKKSGSRLNAG
jgi:actin-like ATPase involved in cell morphogenesis